MQVAYVIYNERPMSGLVRTQVMSVMAAAARQAPDVHFTLVSFWQPWVVRRFWRQLEEMKEELRSAGIGMIVDSGAIVPSRHFLYDRRLFPVLHLWARRLFRRGLAGRGFDIVQCRSYFPSLVATELKRELHYKTIFDMRSLFPLEHITVGTWSEGDASYEMWRRYERWLLTEADAAIGVTAPMLDEIRHIAPCARAVLVPLAADVGQLRFDAAARQEVRRDLHLGDRLVLAYEGSLGLSYLWNNVHNYAAYFRTILGIRPDAHLLLLTPDLHVEIGKVMEQAGIPASRYSVREAARKDLARYLSAADIGMHVMSKGPDSHTRLGVKVVEYLSCGLPVIVNSNVGGAAHVVTTHDVGAVVDLDDPDGPQRLSRLFARAGGMRERCRAVAESQFSVGSCAARWLTLYRELAAGDC